MVKLGSRSNVAGALVTLWVLVMSGTVGAKPALPLELQDGCRRCKGRGVKDCPNHDAAMREAEGRVHFCSVAAACEKCAGTLVVDCDRCEGGPESAAAEARRKAIADWMANSRVAQHFKRNVPRCETERFELVMDVSGKFKIGRKKIDGHALMHLVADDTTFVEERVREHFEVKPEEDYFAKMRMWMWASADDHREAVEVFMNTSARGDFKLLGKDPVFAVWQERGLFSTAQGIRSVFTHNAGHMLVSNLFRQLDVSPHGGGWLDAGVGHWYEYARFDRSVNYCIEEASILENFSNGVWKAALRKMCTSAEASGKSLVIPLLGKITTSMSAREQAVCWSFFDWIVARKPGALRPILVGLKKKQETRDLFKEFLGVNVLDAEQLWRDWVISTYPVKEKTR